MRQIIFNAENDNCLRTLEERRLVSAEFWAIIGVGVALAGLIWRLDVRIARLETRVSEMDRRIARIEGWIAGRFREEAL